jgi:hypothetical protein
MLIGIAADHGGFVLKGQLAASLRDLATRFAISARLR